jgi:probable O-glycosylation ligase (exosortase A-associated)
VRALLVSFLVFGSIPFILRRPSIGIVMWCWLSYMNPHRLSWGFAYNFPFAQVVAIATLLGMLHSQESKTVPPLRLLTVLWLMFYVWTGVTTLTAIHPDEALSRFMAFSKIQLMTLVTIMVMCDPKRLNLLVWAIVLSIGFFGVKGGVFTFNTGGIYRVWGPPGSFIADNNALALALYMLLPLAYYLRKQASLPLVRHGLLATMILMAAAAVGSYSRGGFIAGLSMAAMLWMKSRAKLVTGLVLAIVIPLFLLFMPQSWHDRMNTIGTYEQDRSSMNRIEAWTMAYNAANHRFFGGGFDMWSQEMYDAYGPPDMAKEGGTRGAHSIYFSVLGEHGWVGLALFLSVFFAAWRTASWIMRQTRNVEELEWLGDLARLIQVSLVAYATGGAFQSLAYFDYPWHLVAMLVIGRGIVERHAAETETDVEELVPSRRLSVRPRQRSVHSGA